MYKIGWICLISQKFYLFSKNSDFWSFEVTRNQISAKNDKITEKWWFKNKNEGKWGYVNVGSSCIKYHGSYRRTWKKLKDGKGDPLKTDSRPFAHPEQVRSCCMHRCGIYSCWSLRTTRWSQTSISSFTLLLFFVLQLGYQCITINSYHSITSWGPQRDSLIQDVWSSWSASRKTV